MLFHIVHEFSPTVCVCARYDSVSVLCVWCVKIADVGQGKCFYICDEYTYEKKMSEACERFWHHQTFFTHI